MIFSIGHSTHARGDFLPLARGIDVIVDVRSHPTSRWEQWRQEEMESWLPQHGLRYQWIKDLGGWDTEHYEEWFAPMAEVGVNLSAYSRGVFPKQRIGRDRPAVSDSPEWTNQGLYDYAWFTTTASFWKGLSSLIRDYGSDEQPNAAIMCCEALWWKCHRSMIADVLHVLGIEVRHLPPRVPVRPTTPRWKNHSVMIGNRIERYPEAVRKAWLTTILDTEAQG